MDRPEPGLIKWSPNSAYDSFLHVNLQHRIVQLYEPTGHAQRGKFDYRKVSKHDDFPPLTTYDWSTSIPGLVAIGTSSGIVNLLRVDDNSNAYIELGIRVKRACHAVAFNTGNLLAVGLERVRNDQCLHIWDVNRVSHVDPSLPGFPLDNSQMLDPLHRLEASVAVSSIKFFEDNPQTLAVGMRGQGVRIYDLRDQHGAAMTFSSKCNNNLAIDYADPNYFASSALDQPGVVVWDRRATSRSLASASYHQAMASNGIPWGAALRLDQAIDNQPHQQQKDEDRNSLIRSMRFCRDHRGLLAVLSRTGQLKIFDTHKEITSPGQENEGSPELLQVHRSYDLDLGYLDQNKADEEPFDRIVSFDWITLDSPVLMPRMLVLRASGAFDVLEKPSYTSEHTYKLIPWQAPHRGFEEGNSYHAMVQFEASQYPGMVGPMLIDQALSDIPLFGKEKADISAIVLKILQAPPPQHDCIQDFEACDAPLPESFVHAATIAERLRALKLYVKETFKAPATKTQDEAEHVHPNLDDLTQSIEAMVSGKGGPLSNRQLHEKLLAFSWETKGFPKEARMVLDHIPLERAREKYLFNFATNRAVVSDDPWLRDMWDWIAGAEQETSDDGMVALGIDLSYMGAAAIWADDLGSLVKSRLDRGVPIPDTVTLENCLEIINQRFGVESWEGAETKWPAHRAACARMCGLGRSSQTDFRDYATTPKSERNSSWYTMATAHALFIGDTKTAVQILKTASTEYPELLFISLALQLLNVQGTNSLADELDFDDAVASRTDPYMRAISSLIATNNWETIANQESLPQRDRTFVAVRYFDDDKLTSWFDEQVTQAVHTGDIEAIVLTGITDKLVDIFAKYVEKFNDVQTATLVLSVCAPRYIDDYRCVAWRKAYRAYLQRHKAFFQRTKFEVESTKRSKHGDHLTIKPPSRQVALRCVYCDADYELSKTGTGTGPHAAGERRNPLMLEGVRAGVSCPTCGRHLPRCVVCLEVVGIPRSDRLETSVAAAATADDDDPDGRVAAKFPTFCMKCEHVLHLDHARQWFARHVECPVPKCRCCCNFRTNTELFYP